MSPKKLRCKNPHPDAQKAAAKFPQRLEEIHEGRIVVRKGAEYVNAQTPIKVRCTVCGHRWSTRPLVLINHGGGCPECTRLKNKAAQGIKRIKHSTIEERQQAAELREEGMTYKAIGLELGRDQATIRYWLDPKAREDSKKRSAQKKERDVATGAFQARRKAYKETDHGKANMRMRTQRRRALEHHAIDTVFVDGKWHTVDLWPLIKTTEDREFWSFTDTEQSLQQLGEQVMKLQSDTDQLYHIDHLIPLSKGGIHAACNLQILTKEENETKSNSIRSCDVELFCARLFN
jgi:predicted  nucleic acid-binding Zn-ribbon protein